MKRIFPSYLDGEIGVSKAVCDYLTSRRPNKLDLSKIHLIYNGIDIQKIKTEGELPLNKNKSELAERKDLFIGCVGRLTEQKGYPYIIKAMQRVIQRYPNCLLQIVGEGELKEDLHQMVTDLNLVEHVEFLGLRNDVPALMRTWDIFVLSSLWEGLPTVVMEAMISNIPVIATNIPGTNELVINQETGLLVPEKNVDSLVETIISLLGNPGLQNYLVKNARIHVEQFGMENIARKYYQLYIGNLVD
jgi:glycosyltransferase involved in cell wall biosynthesis